MATSHQRKPIHCASSFRFAARFTVSYSHVHRVKDLVEKFITLYDPTSPSWSNVSDAASALGWSSLLAQTAAHYYDSQGISQLFSREIIEAATRVNYGQVSLRLLGMVQITFCTSITFLQPAQNLDRIHAIEGTVSMAATGASSVKGGNFQMFERFLAHSGAKVYLNTTVRYTHHLFQTLTYVSPGHFPQRESRSLGPQDR